jgi:hypothetical protein
MMDINKLVEELQETIIDQSAKCGGAEMFLYMNPNTATYLSKLYEQEILGCSGNHGNIERIAGSKVVTKRWMDPDIIRVGPWNDTIHMAQLKLDRE